ncbi:MAG: hypothetical protein IPG22_06485 [Acidobacteria bacterium]|nr:hypothetical protein [Acidobacteriota bacterium]
MRGAVDCTVNIERGVVVNYETGDDKFVQSEVAAVVDIANISSKFSPAPGDTLVIGAESYIIDAIAADNGYMARCVLR